MLVIESNKIKEAIEELCIKANTCIDADTYNCYFNAYKQETNEKAKSILAQILKNIELANKKQRPLCQDTGLVVVFTEIGQEVAIEGYSLKDTINKGVSECYKKNHLRKSVVANPLSTRSNTQDNTPAIIHTEIVDGDKIKLSVSIKGGGSENMSDIKMLKPSDGKEGITNFVLETIKNAGSNACPPMRIGIGVGGTMERAAILSKKALFNQSDKTNEIKEFEEELLKKINDLQIGPMGVGGPSTATNVSILEEPCHIASLPVAVNINCHSSRHAECIISKDNIEYDFNKFNYQIETIEHSTKEAQKIYLNEKEKIQKLKAGDEVLLSGTVYTARDAAHKKIIELITNNESLPFDIKNETIFYVGPCPASQNEIIGPIGPTTSGRMDKYATLLHDKGLLATIGKGERSQYVIDSLKKNNAVYFTTTGGVAVYLAQTVKNAQLVAFPELGPEAVYKLEIENMPAIVSIDSNGNCF